MMAPKAGPRHFEISKTGDYIYVINELNSTITALKKGADKYVEIQTISTLKDGFIGMNACADIHLSSDENYLYGSNRGENTIVVFKRNIENGLLEKIQTISVEGDWPRNFTLAPNGAFLLVANQRSKNISTYKVNQKTGTLTFVKSIDAPTPVCLLF
jgi:6-phosphogluconolactonase